MKRRTFLAGTVTALVGVSGCTSSLDSSLFSSSTPLNNYEMKVFQPESEQYENSPPVTEPPVVEFDTDSNTVTVSGSFFVGSSDCNIAVVKKVEYIKSSGKLDIMVGSGTKENTGNTCYGDESADAYQLIVDFDDSLPKTVTATEGEDADSHTTTVKKQNQSSSS